MKFVDEQQNKNSSGIYKITQISNGKMYIGQTKMRFIKRYWHHAWKLNNNSHDNNYLQNAWNKYGADDFEFEVVCIEKDKSILNQLEITYIAKFDCYHNGFNLTTGGEGKKDCPTSEHAKRAIGEKNRINNLGKKASEETKYKMSASSPHRKLTDEQAKALRESRLGSKHTEISKSKMSKSHIGSKNSVSVINENQAYEIKVRLINGEKIIDISNDMRINYAIIKSILGCKVWNHIIAQDWDRFICKYNKNKKKTLFDSQVKQIRKLLNQNISVRNISEICDIGISVVYGIKENRTYKNVI